MNAKEARQRAESLNNEQCIKQVEAINKLIEGAANRGYFNCTYSEPPTEAVKKFFESEGYTIKYQDSGRNEFYYSISW